MFKTKLFSFILHLPEKKTQKKTNSCKYNKQNQYFIIKICISDDMCMFGFTYQFI